MVDAGLFGDLAGGDRAVALFDEQALRRVEQRLDGLATAVGGPGGLHAGGGKPGAGPAPGGRFAGSLHLGNLPLFDQLHERNRGRSAGTRRR
jgi:hypothetical protein